LFHRLANFLCSPARVAHSGESCHQGLLQCIFDLNGVDHCRRKSTAREQFGNVRSDHDMHVGIDEARQQCSTAKVDTLDLWRHLQRAGAHGFDGLALNQHIGPLYRGPTGAINEQRIGQQSGRGHTHLLSWGLYTGHPVPVSAMSQNQYS
jgi:hypothetical protein